MALVNVMEKIVEEKLDIMLNERDCCKCERCIEDMKAMALNRLPAKYASTHNGELFSKLDSTARQNSVDINVAVANAIDCVSVRPSHEVEKGE
ncbi:MAG: late competence development ComFB family protein [Ruminococcaceae bacterium]|nr:late competence development ComFB family protein [Oscillospiraceae bacterium]